MYADLIYITPKHPDRVYPKQDYTACLKSLISFSVEW